MVVSGASLGVAVILWDRLALLTGAPELLPRPADVLATLVDMSRTGELAGAALQSLKRVAVGYCIGTIGGIATGLALGTSRSLNNTVGLLVEFLKGIPPIALVPLAIMWLGIGEPSKYAVIAYIVWIVVGTSTAVGAGEVPLVRLRAGAFLGLSRLTIFTRIVLPSAAPYVVSGMRSAIGFAFVALVSAELIAANSGIGQIIMDARFALQTPRMIVGLLVLGVIGASVQLLFDLVVAKLRVVERS
jgi:ABC-type nitrate/sulfonate/bicarbonate transport system permease component